MGAQNQKKNTFEKDEQEQNQKDFMEEVASLHIAL